MEVALNLLLLPLIGGYWFIDNTHRLSFRAKGLSHYRLLFEAALWGFFALSASHILLTLLSTCSCGTEIAEWWKTWVPFEYAGTALGALAISITTPHFANKRWGKEWSSAKAIAEHGNTLVKLLFDSQRNYAALMLTLKNRKLYVGYVSISVNLGLNPPYITLVPTLSGYRDPRTLRVVMTTAYDRIYTAIANREPGYRDLKVKDFVIAIPTAEIETATPFLRHVSSDLFLLTSPPDGPGHESGPPQSVREATSPEDS